ncbi:hypothetical protein NDU88_005293 [Pleurodeles waltl]|uniref:Telomere-associated protein Rif1 N-terminal domain-containing protein n=1 Tax=Pleurodeles waltl TaxID=8319 RepID=A0AAV7UIC4_PLEWA|nr:hypothetical protein NDU88_005293 [Pleurodeles waltl]
MTRAEDPKLQPLLETLEDGSASQSERTDAFLTLANRLSGEEGKEFTAVVGKQFPRVCKLFKAHIVSENSDLSNAALQALGFCVFNSKIASGLPVTEIHELLTTLISIATKSPDKNTCTRALWVIAKQCFPSEEVGKLVPEILSTLETVLNRGDVQSMVIEYEALNTVIRLLEQTPMQMGEEAPRWAKLVIPLVVHSAPRVRLRGATALEMGIPLLLQKQQDVAAITEPLMSTKIISELQRLFSTKNETYVLKLWPLFVKLLGKTLHRSGSFINSLLQLEELGFRSGSPVIKKIAFIAWKSLIDNFALNPDILSSTKRLKLLMQPLCSIHVRTEALALTKLEVWWYLLMRLGAQLSANFEQVCAPLIQNTLTVDSSNAAPITPARGSANQSLNQTGMKAGPFPFGSPTTPKMNLNSSSLSSAALPSVQLLGLEMLLHFLLGPEVVTFAKKNNLVLGLEPLQHPLISSSSFFCKHASTLLNAVQDGFIAVGKDASDAIVQVIWKDMISLVKATIEAGTKRDRQGSDVLPLLLQALKNIVTADVLPAQKALTLIESTIKGLPQKALGSPAYQMANMDLLHGTPALFLIQLLFHSSVLEQCAVEERFFICLETLVSCVLSGPTSPLAFSESVVGVISMQAKLLENKEHIWRMWSIVVNPLTEKINQTNEVNQGDALEHNFNAMHAALTLPVNHLYPVQGFPQPSMKTLLRTWAELYKTFSRCAALVATTEENVCCEELCAKILAGIGEQILTTFSTLDCIAQNLLVMVECINFLPYSSKYPPKTKAPQTPTDWAKKKQEPLGNLTSFLKLLVKLIDSFHALASKEPTPEMPTPSLVSVGNYIIGIVTSTISRIALSSVIRKLFEYLTKPLAAFYEKTSKSSDVPKVYSSLGSKLEKLLSEILLCLQSRYSGAHESDLLEDISPLLCVIFLHKNKQIRNQTAQFWNATFAKTTMLLYPAELKPVLSKVKQQTPILLPGFETVEVGDVSSGPFSDPQNENSQLDTKISGMEVKSAGKRNSMMAQAEELKDRGTPVRSKQAKLKLDFSSPKNKPAEKFLDEEKSMDFVFIPPETKERVLTEHQKEVLRTKRVDIPTMYNNLDASQDTTSFAQYTQSQEDSVEKPVGIIKDTEAENQLKDGENLCEEEEMDTEAPGSNKVTECVPEEKLFNESISKEENMSIGGNTSTGSNGSASSDVVSDTPPLSASRRQSFITLEKFDSSGNKQFSPSSNKFPVTNVVSLPGVKRASTGAQTKNVGKRKMEGKKVLDAKSAKTSPFGSGQKSDIVEVDNPNQGEILASGDQVEDSMNISTCGESKSTEEQMLLEDAECIPDTQEVESNVLPLDGGFKESKRVNDAQADIEFKENKPPGEGTMDLKSSSDILIQNTAANQKSLRRSSRRRLDVSESGIGDKQKIDHLKKDASVGNEMSVHSDLQTKGVLQQNKPIPEKVDGLLGVGQNENVVENSDASSFGKEVLNDLIKKEVLTDLAEKVLGDLSKNNVSDPDKKEVSSDLAKKKILSELGGKNVSDICEKGSFSQEDTSKGTEGSLDDGSKPETGDSQDFSSEKEIKEQSAVRSRYQTRRASLILLPGTENSESDSSETKEDIITKKRSRRRPKSMSTMDPKNDEQSQKQDLPALRVGDKGPLLPNKNEVSSSEKDKNITELCKPSEPKDKSKTNCTSVNDTSGFRDSNKRVIEQSASEVEPKNQIITSVSTESYISEPDVQTVHSNKTYDVVQGALEGFRKTESLITEPTMGDFSSAGSDVFFSSENSVIPLECQHKRSKRLRKSKGCDCCSGQLHEKPTIELKSSEKHDLKLVDHNIKSVPAIVSADEASSVEEQLEDSVFVGPSAQSTPLLPSKKPLFFKVSVDQASSVGSEDENTVVPQITNCENTEEAALVCSTPTAPVAELEEQDDQMCEPRSPVESVFKGSQEKHIIKLGTVCDKPITLVQEEKTDTLVEEVLAEALPTNAAVLISECDQNETISDNIQIVSSCLSASEVQSSLTTEVQLDSAVLGQGGCVEQPMDIATSAGQFEEKAALQKSGVDIITSEEPAFVSSVISGEHIMPDTVTPGYETVMDTATSGVQTVVPVVTSEEQSNLDVSSSEEHSMVCVEASDRQASKDSAVSGGQTAGGIDVVGSPPKFKGLECATLVSINGSPSEVQARCIWSPSASPSTSILKKGVKRPQEEESPSPLNKMRRVSFADPIYKEEMADDIDRRSPVVRCLSSSASSPTARALKISSTVQCKLITTPTKGFISPGSRSLGPKSSKKCLITEMAKESLPSPKESVYPALINCTTPVDIILPQITSNMWARGLGQLVRAKNIKTIGDLSTLTITEIKTLPIRSPKISTVKKALRVFHEQQMKTRGFDEFVALEEADKQINGLDDKTSPPDDDSLAPDLLESASLLTDGKPSTDLMAQIDALALRLTPEELSRHSGSILFEAQEKLSSMTNCVMRHLQTRWTSPPHESST